VSPETFAILAVAVLISSFVQGSIGIGFALIIAPLLGVMMPSLLPVTLLLLMLPMNFLVAWRERQAIDWPGVRWIMLGRLPGTLVGVWILAVLSAGQLDFTVGLFTVIAAGAALAAPRFDPNRPAALSVGAFTGVTETATGIGGPPLALLYQHARAPVLRASVAVSFLLGEVLSLALLAVAGQIRVEQVAGALYLAPFVLVGTVLSRVTHAKIGGTILRVCVLAFAVASGLLLMLQALGR
jgi:uncharacterized protein